jgi:hypothetical protein
MHLDPGLGASEICPWEETQREIDGRGSDHRENTCRRQPAARQSRGNPERKPCSPA